MRNIFNESPLYNLWYTIDELHGQVKGDTMKKTKKSMIILFSILAVIGIAVGGCSMHQYQKKQE